MGGGRPAASHSFPLISIVGSRRLHKCDTGRKRVRREKEADVFNSNVQPKRRMKEKPTAWQCECREARARYHLNLAHLMRCPVMRRGAPRRSSRPSRHGSAMIEGARRHGHFDPRWHAEGLRPRHGKAASLSMIRTGEVTSPIGNSATTRHSRLTRHTDPRPSHPAPCR
jgi:hypothetical protein